MSADTPSNAELTDVSSAELAPESDPHEAPAPLQLREPLPDVTDTAGGLTQYCAAIAEGSGPIAIDAERASGYRYSQRAYLVQLRRCGAGTGLIDPIAFDDLTPVNAAIGDNEWILHAATQDLPCLREVGMSPSALFDTELAGRLLHMERVGLASLVERLVGASLAKQHSAVDWSKRPLPEPWLDYAALDVEVLIELRDLLDQRLQRAGKREWAQQEFDALLAYSGPEPKPEPWRRTSGIHKLKSRRQLAIVRSVWTSRDQIACEQDTSPGRILADSAIIEIAQEQPRSRGKLRDLRSMRARGPRRFMDQWHRAIEAAFDLSDDALPRKVPQPDGPPPPRVWSHQNPEAANRLGACKHAVSELAEVHDLPTENLMPPQSVRRLAWEPPRTITATSVAENLAAHGARHWQIELLAHRLAGELR